jgi:molecular chaperone DnaJ
MPTTRDYYQVLGVERGAAAEDIKRAYRRMAMKYHPDRNPGDNDAEERFKECAEAYEVLSEEDKRRVYDRYGHAGLRSTPGHDFHSMNAEDIFSMFSEIFGGSFGGRRARRGGIPRGYDLETDVEITLEEVLAGAERDVEFKRLDICATCEGSGAKPGSTRSECATCGGQGQVAQAGLGGMFRMVTTCPRCGGRGSVITDPCGDCRGSGRISVKRKLSVRIPAGIRDGQAVRVQGEGEPPPPEISPAGQGIRGDLHVVVRVRKHAGFEREGDKLLTAVPVAFTQAALGADITVETLDGPRSLTVAPGTQHGTIFTIEGAGLPNLRTGKRNDMVVIVQLIVPRKLNDSQRQLLRQYAESEDIEVGTDTQSWWDKLKDAMSGS